MGFLPSGPEVWVILIIILIVFGAGKLPEIGGALGKGIREFRSSQQEAGEDDEDDEDNDEMEAMPATAKSAEQPEAAPAQPATASETATAEKKTA